MVADGGPAADVLEPLPDGSVVGGSGDGASAEAAEEDADEAPDGLEVEGFPDGLGERDVWGEADEVVGVVEVAMRVGGCFPLEAKI